MRSARDLAESGSRETRGPASGPIRQSARVLFCHAAARRLDSRAIITALMCSY